MERAHKSTFTPTVFLQHPPLLHVPALFSRLLVSKRLSQPNLHPLVLYSVLP